LVAEILALRARVEKLEAELRDSAKLRETQKRDAIDKLAARVAHEVNTPAQFVSDNVSFLDNAFPAVVELLEKIEVLVDAVGAGSVPAQLVRDIRSAQDAADIGYLVVEMPRAMEQTINGVRRIAKIVAAMKDFVPAETSEEPPLDGVEGSMADLGDEWGDMS